MRPQQQAMDFIHLPLDKMANILADDNFGCIFLNENERIPIRTSLKFVPRSLIHNKLALVQVMAWHRTSHYLKQCWPSSLTHIIGTRGKWVKIDDCGPANRLNISEHNGSLLWSATRFRDISWIISWWRHQMETFSALLALCAGNSPVSGEIPSQRPVTRSFDVFFDLRLNKRLSEQ